MTLAFALVMVAALLFQAGQAYAAEEAQKVELLIDHNGGVLIKNLFFIDSTGKDRFLVQAFSPSNIEVFDSSGSLEYEVSRGLIEARLREQKDGYSFTVQYTSDFFTSKNNSEWTFSYLYTNLGQIGNVRLTAALPQNAQINSFTPGGIIYQDSGLLKIEWVLPPGSQSFSVDIEYTFSSAPSAGNNYDYSSAIGVLVSIALVIALLAYFFSKARKMPRKKQIPLHEAKAGMTAGQRDVMRTLTINERAIVNELFQHKDMTQKKLGLKTGIPKATLSRTLKKLEAKSIIESHGYGTTRLVRLAEWFAGK